jgi:hypothetical protein
MGFDPKQLKEPSKPSTASAKKELDRSGSLHSSCPWALKKTLHQIHHLRYCRHAIPLQCYFWRGLLNTFEAALHSDYLCLKIQPTFSVITVFCSQQDARNIEKGFAPGYKNMNWSMAIGTLFLCKIGPIGGIWA